MSAGAADDLLATLGKQKFSTVLADPPWQFQNCTGKMAAEHRRLSCYGTMTLRDIENLPIEAVVEDTAHDELERQAEHLIQETPLGEFDQYRAVADEDPRHSSPRRTGHDPLDLAHRQAQQFGCFRLGNRLLRQGPKAQATEPTGRLVAFQGVWLYFISIPDLHPRRPHAALPR